jgi:chitinase
MKELRNALDQLENKNGKHYELSIAMSAELDLLPTIQYDKVLNYVDFINMMTYDLSGSWNSYTSHQTPLYTNKAYNKNTMSGAKNSADACITYFEETYGSTIDMSKILIGVAAYTRGWAKVQDDGLDKNNPGLYATAAINSVINSDGNEGIYPFGDIEEIMLKYDLSEYFDNTAKAAYYYSAKNGYFFTCDNEQSVEAKGNYVRKKGLGGLIMWMASQDNNNKLQKAMFKSLFGENYSLPSQKPVYTYPNAKINIVQTDSGCEITVVNNEEIVENNLALKTAELFQKSILFFKLYIKTESGIKCSAGTGSGTIVNNDGTCIIDPSSNSEARIISPGNNYKFKIKVSSALTKSEIVSIKMTQRITPSSKEFKEQTLSSL